MWSSEHIDKLYVGKKSASVLGRPAERTETGNTMAYITVDNPLVVLLGTPLRQSVSYLAQNRVYERLGLDYYYIPVEVKSSDQLRTVVAGLKQMNLGGLAVTKPYKRDDSAVFGRHG